MILRAGVLTSGGWSDWLFLEKLFFAVDQGIDVISGELKTVSVGNCVRWARFDTVTTENAARIIDVVNAGIAFPCRDAAGIGILGGFNVDAICGAGRRAEKASNALFEPGFVAVQYMYSAIARLKMHCFERVILRNRFPEHVPESDTKSLHQCAERLADFPKDGGHRLGV
jgi:hypothetical protein